MQTLERALSSQEQLDIEHGNVQLISDFRNNRCSKIIPMVQHQQTTTKLYIAGAETSSSSSSPVVQQQQMEREDSNCSLNSNVSTSMVELEFENNNIKSDVVNEELSSVETFSLQQTTMAASDVDEKEKLNVFGIATKVL